MAIPWIKMAELGFPAIAALINSDDKKKKEQLIKDIIQEVDQLRVENRLIRKRLARLTWVAGVNAVITVVLSAWIAFR